MSFTLDETTIGMKGASGLVWITKRDDGSIRDVICHMKMPGHWIFKTESKRDNDWLGGFDALSPVGKNGKISLEYEFGSPSTITYWKWRDEEIGWYGYTTNVNALIDQFKEMGKFLSSDEAKAQFDSLYEGRAQEPEEPREMFYRWEANGMVAYPLSAPAGAGASGLSDEERREKNRKAKERAKKRKAAAKEAVKTTHLPVGMVYSV